MGIKWTKDKIKDGFERFHKEFGRYPTSAEIDKYYHLPSSRQIQRSFGGLPSLRKELGLKGPSDFTKGEYSADRARSIAKRAHKVELEVYTYLRDVFGKPFVHREFFFTDDKRTRVDFFVYTKNGNFSVDVFYPKDKRNLLGCLNSKFRLYRNSSMIQYPVIFLMMNEDIGEEELKEIISNKEIKPNSMQSVMVYEQFKKFCKTKKPMNSIGGF